MHNRKVLVLNLDYQPLTLCTVQRAFVLVYLSKVELIESYADMDLHTVSKTYSSPAVIRILKYVNHPHKGVSLTRQNIFKRDAHECQYCGRNKDLTVDHVIPRAKGGKTIWKNLVTACKKCNTLKGDNKPSERGLTLKQAPFRPSYISFIRDFSGLICEEWKPFLYTESSKIAM